MPIKEQVSVLAIFYKAESNEIFVAYLSDKIVYEVKDPDLALKAMKAAEAKIKYQRKKKKE